MVIVFTLPFRVIPTFQAIVYLQVVHIIRRSVRKSFFTVFVNSEYLMFEVRCLKLWWPLSVDLVVAVEYIHW